MEAILGLYVVRLEVIGPDDARAVTTAVDGADLAWSGGLGQLIDRAVRGVRTQLNLPDTAPPPVDGGRYLDALSLLRAYLAAAGGERVMVPAGALRRAIDGGLDLIAERQAWRAVRRSALAELTRLRDGLTDDDLREQIERIVGILRGGKDSP